MRTYKTYERYTENSALAMPIKEIAPLDDARCRRGAVSTRARDVARPGTQAAFPARLRGIKSVRPRNDQTLSLFRERGLTKAFPLAFPVAFPGDRSRTILFRVLYYTSR